MNEQDLILRMQEGDETAFEALVRLYEKKVYTLCRRMCANEEDAQEAAQAQTRRDASAEKGYVEKSNKDETFHYHIAKVREDDDALHEEPVLTNEDFVLGIRPESLKIGENGTIDGEIYGAMPTGMESTVKVRIGDFLLTGVVFGSTLFAIGSKIRLDISGDSVMLFDRKSGRRIVSGSLDLGG